MRLACCCGVIAAQTDQVALLRSFGAAGDELAKLERAPEKAPGGCLCGRTRRALLEHIICTHTGTRTLSKSKVCTNGALTAEHARSTSSCPPRRGEGVLCTGKAHISATRNPHQQPRNPAEPEQTRADRSSGEDHEGGDGNQRLRREEKGRR